MTKKQQETLDVLLYESARDGKLFLVKFLIDFGANIHAWKGSTLCVASLYGHFEIAKLLVEHGANIHADDDAALRWASNHGHFDIVKFLVEHGADIHAYDDWAIVCAKTQEIKEYLEVKYNE